MFSCLTILFYFLFNYFANKLLSKAHYFEKSGFFINDFAGKYCTAHFLKLKSKCIECMLGTFIKA